jgi:Domain of unknown function (DUF4166)/Saccharopine dehydrogenase NADP binding domain
MSDGLKILIVGGYGIFGGRIVELLENEPRLTLFVGGRSVDKAGKFIAERKRATARLVPIRFDRDENPREKLSALEPDIVVDASGPFQTYGDHRYRIVEACLAHGANYLDLADGADFVNGINAFDDRAKAAGLYVLSGVSSFPVLTAAAVRRLSTDMAAVKTIRGGIAPSPYAVVGENVIRAIASYAGKPLRRKRRGKFGAGYPLTEQIRYTIATPGQIPLRSTLFSLMDVPDLQALPKLWPEADDVWMGAGPRPEILHRFLIGLAWLVRLRILPALSLAAPLLHFVANHVRWGEHRGGMFVEVDGMHASGARLSRSWHLIADGDDGPFIPSMAVEAIVSNALQGRPPRPGARTAVHDLELDDYDRLFAKRTIYAGVRFNQANDAAPLYARILGGTWDALPAEIRAMHDARTTAVAEGRAQIQRGRSPLARLAAAFIGFPATNPDVPVRVQFDASNGCETWTRRFGRDSFRSWQFAGRDRSDGLLCERFGPLTFAMALVATGGCLSLVLRRWSAFGLPLPMWLCPRSASYESAEQGRFNFHVKISHPLTGLIIRYDGWLVPLTATASRS